MPSQIPSINVTNGLSGGLNSGGSSFLDDLSTLLPGLGSLGTILGKQSQGDQNAQATQGQLTNSANGNLINLFGQQQNAQNQAGQLDLQRQQFTTNNRAASAKQALLASLLGGGYEGAQVHVPGIQNAQISGGLLDTLKHNPQAMAAMATLGSQASDAQNTPQTYSGGNILTPPTLAKLPDVTKGSAAGKAGGFLQDVATILPAILSFL